MADTQGAFSRLLAESRFGGSSSTERLLMWVFIAISVVVVIMAVVLIMATQRGWFGFRKPTHPKMGNLLHYLYMNDIPFERRRTILHPFVQAHYVSPPPPPPSHYSQYGGSYHDQQIPYNDRHGGARASPSTAWEEDEEQQQHEEESGDHHNEGIPITVHAASEDDQPNIVSGTSGVAAVESV